MKAITTRYRGPTNTRGARIIASDGDGSWLSFPYPYQLNGEQAHADSAIKFRDRRGWTGAMIGGQTKEGYVFVFESGTRYP